MKACAFILALVFALMLTSCGGNVEYQEATSHEIAQTGRTEPPTQAEKDASFERHLINRLQSTIEDNFETVDEVAITVEQPSETEQNIAVAITMKSGEQLTEEQEAGIVNLINNSFSSDLPLHVSLTQEPQESQ